jgi:sensor histidine kinase YesM
VENAIRHGLEPKIDGGEIVLSMRREGDRLCIEVSDTGVGFGAATRGGVGLTNIRERLRLLHGDAGQLDIGDNGTAGGARVTLTVPA